MVVLNWRTIQDWGAPLISEYPTGFRWQPIEVGPASAVTVLGDRPQSGMNEPLKYSSSQMDQDILSLGGRTPAAASVEVEKFYKT